LIDLIDRKTINLNKIKFLVFDEADRMLDMGFIHDITRILKHLPKELQTMLFSATVSKEITELSKKYLNNPIHVILESSLKPEFLQQTYYQTTPDQKLPLLIHLLKKERDLSLVFCNRKHITSKIAGKLTRYGIHARCLHGDLSQNQREKITADFKNKKFNILIATDVASRGLHIEDISHVYNYEIPKDVDSYTHRVGRTARAGKKGEAISLVTNGEEQKFFKQILFNYRGRIILKTVNTSELPKIESESFDKKRTNRQSKFNTNKSFRKDERKKFQNEDTKGGFRQKKNKSFIDNNYQSREKVQPDSHGKKKRATWDKIKSMIWGNDNTGSQVQEQTARKNKQRFSGKKKSASWEDRKPKFWNKGKPKRRFS
jgi:superfamily II DNA/RNA helicase